MLSLLVLLGNKSGGVTGGAHGASMASPMHVDIADVVAVAIERQVAHHGRQRQRPLHRVGSWRRPSVPGRRRAQCGDRVAEHDFESCGVREGDDQVVVVPRRI